MLGQRVRFGIPRRVCEKGLLPRVCLVTGERETVRWHTVQVHPRGPNRSGVLPLTVELPLAEGQFSRWASAMRFHERFEELTIFGYLTSLGVSLVAVGWLVHLNEILAGLLLLPAVGPGLFLGLAEVMVRRRAPTLHVDDRYLWLTADSRFRDAVDQFHVERRAVLKRLIERVAAPKDPRPACRAHGRPSVETCARCGDFVCEICFVSAALCEECRERPRVAELTLRSPAPPLRLVAALAFVPGNLLVQLVAVVLGIGELVRDTDRDCPRSKIASFVALCGGTVGAVTSVVIALLGWRWISLI